MSSEPKICEWNEIKSSFKKSRLIVGNGLSMQFDGKFCNLSLLDSMLECLKENACQLINNHNTTADDIEKCKKILLFHKEEQSAELVRFRIDQAKWILDLLSSEIDPISKDKYEKFFEAQDSLLKNVFIRVINNIHPPWNTIKDKLSNYHEFIKTFKYVFSLNYDLIIYWLFMSLLNGKDSTTCCDGFTREKDDDPLVFSLSNIKPDRIGFFYLHGNICLHKDKYNTIIKRERSKSDLLTEISSYIEKDGLPFLISEGSSEKKEEAIHFEKDYTSVVYEELLTNRYPYRIFGKKYAADDSLVIYGCSLINDQHIIRQALKSNCRKIAISIFNKSDPYYNLLKILNDKKKKIQVVCFKSQSIFPSSVLEQKQK